MSQVQRRRSDRDALFSILGMVGPCLAALSRQPPKPAGARPSPRGVDGDSAGRAIMAIAKNAERRNGLIGRVRCQSGSTLGVNDLATNRQPARHEVVTHVLGTTCYLCLRSGQAKRGGPGRTRTCNQTVVSGGISI